MRITFIATVFNEEENIIRLLDSLFSQSRMPDEIIIVDGGSSDKTELRIKNYELRIRERAKFKFIIKNGNRSVGRNEAVKNSTGDIILCSDAGCILDRLWIEKMIEPFHDDTVDVVAGYYEGITEGIFQKCLIPYVLVMPDRINPDTFLPASRSMGFRRHVWEKIGGFPEQYSHNEDYIFANQIKRLKYKIFFQRKAVVYWIPRKNIPESFYMFFRFASGDANAGIFRSKVGLIFLRYFLGILILFLAIIREDLTIGKLVFAAITLYIFWAIAKNYKYVRDVRAFIFLPILQIVSDAAVIAGTALGIIKLWVTKMKL